MTLKIFLFTLFRIVCTFCHKNYGLQLTEQVFNCCHVSSYGRPYYILIILLSHQIGVSGAVVGSIDTNVWKIV